jgi:hypothetical protein
MNYKVFSSLIYQFQNKKISKGLFTLQWAEEQKRQGLIPLRICANWIYRLIELESGNRIFREANA